MNDHLPRLVFAGLAGDVGKSLVSLGAIAALRSRGKVVAPFKKGPDFIDAAWLGRAAGRPGRNLDTFMMPRTAILASLAGASREADVAVIEGNRGLFDGLDAQGSHSTAQLARLVDAPVVLVVDATKVTRTVAALVLGCRALDPELELAGVVLNRVGTERQREVITEAVTREAGLAVLGAIPRQKGELLPDRHLGLVTQLEHPRADAVLAELGALIEEHVDLDALLALAARAPDLSAAPPAGPRPQARCRVGVLRDKAFSFYYPENLTALEEAGAELVPISPLADAELPQMDALYAGGGFPEVHARELSANASLRGALRERIEAGLPVWAECGGLMYLSEYLEQDGERYPMVGALPLTTSQKKRPQGHGYVRARVDASNPFLPEGTEFSGHEFHYSCLEGGAGETSTVLQLERGVGIGGGRDGLHVKNVVASYTHLHALGTPQWAPGFTAAVGGEGLMGLREEVLAAIERGDEAELDELIAARPRALRFLMGLTYQDDEVLRKRAGRAIALGARHHPRLVQNLARRLIWAMNDESGTNALTVPDVMVAIAEERPKLLLPLVPDMIRLSTDEGLQAGLVQALQTIVERCPGKVGVELQKSLRERLPKEEYDYDEL